MNPTRPTNGQKKNTRAWKASGTILVADIPPRRTHSWWELYVECCKFLEEHTPGLALWKAFESPKQATSAATSLRETFKRTRGPDAVQVDLRQEIDADGAPVVRLYVHHGQGWK